MKKHLFKHNAANPACAVKTVLGEYAMPMWQRSIHRTPRATGYAGGLKRQ